MKPWIVWNWKNPDDSGLQKILDHSMLMSLFGEDSILKIYLVLFDVADVNYFHNFHFQSFLSQVDSGEFESAASFSAGWTAASGCSA